MHGSPGDERAPRLPRRDWRPLLLALLVGGVIGALVILLWLGSSAEPTADAAPSASAEDHGGRHDSPGDGPGNDADTIAGAATAAATTQPAALPPLDTPLADIVEDLQRRAAAGDGRASCRLASELEGCAQLARRQASLAGYLARRQQEMANESDAELHAALADETELMIQRGQELLDTGASHCAGVAPATDAEIARLWRQSALQGNLVGLRTYASGNAFAWESIMDHLPALTRFRGEAEAMALQAVQQGDFDMLLALASAYAPYTDIQRAPTLLAQVVKPDRVKALVMFRHALDLVAADGGDGAAELQQRIQLRLQAIEDVAQPGESDLADAHRRTQLADWAKPTLRGLAQLSAGGEMIKTFRGWCDR